MATAELEARLHDVAQKLGDHSGDLLEIADGAENLSPEQERAVGAHLVDLEAILGRVENLLQKIFHEPG